MDIIVDTRESSETLIDELIYQGLDFTRAGLKEGDIYFPEDDVVIERKTAEDFVASFLGDSIRLFSQCERLTQHKTAIVIIEGNIYDTRSSVAVHSIIGAVSAVVAGYGISVFPVPDTRAFAMAIRFISDRLENGEDIFHSRTRHKSDAGTKKEILTCVKGVGLKRATGILDRAGGSLRYIIRGPNPKKKVDDDFVKLRIPGNIFSEMARIFEWGE